MRYNNRKEVLQLKNFIAHTNVKNQLILKFDSYNCEYKLESVAPPASNGIAAQKQQRSFWPYISDSFKFDISWWETNRDIYIDANYLEV